MTFIHPGPARNVNTRGAIMPTKLHIDGTQDDAGQPGVAIGMTLPTGDKMTVALSTRHAEDLAIGLAAFLVGPDVPESETR